MKKFLILLVTILSGIGFFGLLIYGNTFKRTTIVFESVEYDEVVIDGMTYGVFKTSNSIAVANITKDKLEINKLKK